MQLSITSEELVLLREAALGRAGEITARVTGGDFSLQDERRCCNLAMLANDGLLAQRPAAGHYAVWRLTRSARATLKSVAALN
jgi:hypothetical protein